MQPRGCSNTFLNIVDSRHFVELVTQVLVRLQIVLQSLLITSEAPLDQFRTADQHTQNNKKRDTYSDNGYNQKLRRHWEMS